VRRVVERKKGGSVRGRRPRMKSAKKRDIVTKKENTSSEKARKGGDHVLKDLTPLRKENTRPSQGKSVQPISRDAYMIGATEMVKVNIT